MTTIQLRFRHSAGDLGPFPFPDNTLVQTVKEKVLAEWPKDGEWSKETPGQVADIKLIASGKFVESTKCLKDYSREMGEIKPDTVVTLHVLIRPAASSKKPAGSSPQGGTLKDDEDGSKGCSCVIS